MRLSASVEGSPESVWRRLLSRMAGNLELPPTALRRGAAIATSDGAQGHVLQASDGVLRFTWQEPDWPRSSSVAITVSADAEASPVGCRVSILHEDVGEMAVAWYRDFWEKELAMLG